MAATITTKHLQFTTTFDLAVVIEKEMQKYYRGYGRIKKKNCTFCYCYYLCELNVDIFAKSLW